MARLWVEFTCLCCELTFTDWKDEHSCSSMCQEHRHTDICSLCYDLSIKSFERQMVAFNSPRLRFVEVEKK